MAQFIILIFIQTLMLAYMCAILPFDNMKRNCVEIVNELTVSILLIFVTIFMDEKNDIYSRFTMGYVTISILLGTVFFNWAIVSHETFTHVLKLVKLKGFDLLYSKVKRNLNKMKATPQRVKIEELTPVIKVINPLSIDLSF